MTSQWAVFTVFALVIGSLVYAFFRGGMHVRRDPRDDRRRDQGAPPPA